MLSDGDGSDTVPTHLGGGGLARWTERGAWRSLGPGAKAM
jgi:hypothetical protein